MFFTSYGTLLPVWDMFSKLKSAKTHYKHSVRKTRCRKYLCMPLTYKNGCVLDPNNSNKSSLRVILILWHLLMQTFVSGYTLLFNHFIFPKYQINVVIKNIYLKINFSSHRKAFRIGTILCPNNSQFYEKKCR